MIPLMPSMMSRAAARKLVKLAVKHQKDRQVALNLVASENRPSRTVRLLQCSDMASRYLGELYGGTATIRECIERSENAFVHLFNKKHVDLSPVSGNIAVLSVLLGLSEPDSEVYMHSTSNGGYPANLGFFQRHRIDIPEIGNSIDIESLSEIVASSAQKSGLIIVGKSLFIEAPPLAEIARMLEGSNWRVVLDASHVLGLIAGHQFIDMNAPVDLILGSTHKSFPGIQGGTIMTDQVECFALATQGSRIEHSRGLMLVDNAHAHRIIAQGVTALEMQQFGKEYASQIIRNSRALGKALHSKGMTVKRTSSGSFSDTHQVMLDYPAEVASEAKYKLEAAGIYSDVILRFGTSETTRLGFKEEDMKIVADFIASVILDDTRPKSVRSEVAEFMSGFQTVHFSFDDQEELDSLLQVLWS